MQYTVDVARQRFSLWAACRAAQAGSAKAKRSEFVSALKACGVIEFLAESENHTITRERYDKEFDTWVIKVQSHLETECKKPMMYGIAAKLVSTYLKSEFLLGGFEDTDLARYMSPPIDSLLLKGIDEAHDTSLAGTYKWQKLTRDEYKELLSTLRTMSGETPVWHLEQHWNP